MESVFKKIPSLIFTELLRFPHLYCKIKISRIFKAPKGVGRGMCYEQDAAPPRCFPNQSSIFRILLDQWFLTFLKIHFRINPFAAGLVRRQGQCRLTAGKRRRPRKGRLVASCKVRPEGGGSPRPQQTRPSSCTRAPRPAGGARDTTGASAPAANRNPFRRPGNRGRQGAPGALDAFPLLCAFGSATKSPA